MINNAGMGISGSVEKTSERDFDSISDVNFKGTYNCIRFGLPLLRQSKGRLVNVSSVAGAIAIPYQAFYSATKAAVLSLSDALRNEVRPFGVKVLAVLPGDVKTCFTESRRKNADEGVYAAYAENSVKVMEKDEQQGMSAAYAAKKNLCLRRQKKYAARQGHRREIQIFVFCGRHFAEAAQRLAAVQNLRRRELKLLTIHENSANILCIKDF